MSVDVLKLRQALLKWYRAHKRDLPWRHTQDPYKIWVSEIMLQQTQVQTVIPYWKKFLRVFPNIKTLAEADQEDLMHLWQGLGYYRRAKYLQKAAKTIVNDWGGQLPNTQSELIKLPGFGPYTSGAVASIAFGQKVPCIDGNVTRVLSRVLATHTQEDIQACAFDLAQSNDPSSINQSLMEMGATMCHAKKPTCRLCPAKKYCMAFAQDKVSQFPAPKKRTQVKHVYAASLVLFDLETGSYLLQKRPAHGRWAGLWEFPYFEWDTRQPCTKHKAILKKKFSQIKKLKQVGCIKHQLTHQKIATDVYAGQALKPFPTQEQYVWTQNFENVSTSVLNNKVLNLHRTFQNNIAVKA